MVVPDELLLIAKAIDAETVENTSAVPVALARRILWSMLGASSRARPIDSTRKRSSTTWRART
ncbi:hypothetical protein GCM10010464_32420 [Pseudonocardia yunnanensis]|uniref:Uncharacterized protein n=1 Tax=Pseudonocardia yunnanensis TaxID=58107 RepID=A0ABW4F5A3_9PSEU